MNAILTPNQIDMDVDLFTVQLPIQLPAGIQVNEFEYPIIKLQEVIIDDLLFKLNQKQAQAESKLRQMYNALLDERNEILSDRDRANVNAETFRNLRNKAETERDQAAALYQTIQSKQTKQIALINELQTTLRQAQEQIEGIPKLVENKVLLALATASVDSKELITAKTEIKSLQNKLAAAEDKRNKSAIKNVELDKQVRALRSELSHEKSHVEMLVGLVENQKEQIGHMQEGVRNADENYHCVMHNIDEVLAYAAIVAHENEELRNDNFYLSEAVQYHDLKIVWRNGDWQAFALCKAKAIRPRKGDPRPDERFGLLYVMNTNSGHGHTCYFGQNGSLCIPETVEQESRVPQSLWNDFTKSASLVPIDKIERALDRAAKRTKKIVEVAQLLDLDWAVQIDLVEIAQRLSDYVPEYELTRSLSHLERAKLLAPQNLALIGRINKRFNTNYATESQGGRLPDISGSTLQKNEKPMRGRKKGKRR